MTESLGHDRQTILTPFWLKKNTLYRFAIAMNVVQIILPRQTSITMDSR
jgi:hypothetical protein